MIEHVWTVICSRSSIDNESKNISLFNVIEQVNILGPLPEPAAHAAAPIPFEIVTLWTRAQLAEAEESMGRLTVIGPNGADAYSQEFTVNLTENTRMRTQMRSAGFPLLGTGRYTFKIEIQRPAGAWEAVAHIPVQVESVAQAPAQGVGPAA